jgi:hypothetical protein
LDFGYLGKYSNWLYNEQLEVDSWQTKAFLLSVIARLSSASSDYCVLFPWSKEAGMQG